jgi:hypothetical protein
MSAIKISLFNQILERIDREQFNRVVAEYDSDKYSKGINTWTHFVTMLFMQLGHLDSLRDICTGLKSATGNLSHLGIRKPPSKSSLSYINSRRRADVFEALYFALLDKLEPSCHRRRSYAQRLKRKVFIMDSSVIPLSLSLFNWAKFRTTKGAIKLHAVLDYDTGLPNYAVISDGKKHDVKVAQETLFPAGSVLVADRAYVDYAWLNNLDSSGVFFVTRLKSNADIKVIQEYLAPDKDEHILSDEDIALTGFYSSQNYPKRLRIVRVYDEQNDQKLTLLTNQLTWTAATISHLYKARWDVEVFFKHLKQLFKVRTFIGTSENAVRIQMWCSMIAILLLKYFKNKAQYPWQLSNLTAFLRINLFVKIDLWAWLHNPIIKRAKPPPTVDLFSAL